jgi:hypothetical protein
MRLGGVGNMPPTALTTTLAILDACRGAVAEIPDRSGDESDQGREIIQ